MKQSERNQVHRYKSRLEHHRRYERNKKQAERNMLRGSSGKLPRAATG